MSTFLSQQLRAIVSKLSDLKVSFALVGGLAVSSHTMPRFTKDIDLCLAVESDAKAEETIRALLHQGFQLVTLLEHKNGNIATARLVLPLSPASDPEVDLIFSTCGIESEIISDSQILSVLGISIRVATPGHLIAMKVLSESEIRLTDKQDLLNLLHVATSAEITRAKNALSLITRRGFNRKKDLLGTLERYLRESGKGP